MRRLGGLLLLAATACSRGSVSEPAGDAGVSAHAPTLHLATVRRLAAADPVWSAVLGATGLRRAPSGFEAGAFTDAGAGVPMAFGARAPAFGDGALEVRAGDAQVSLRVLDALGVEGTLVDGDVVYADVHPSTDFVVAAGPGRVESFWSLRDAAAPTSFQLSVGQKGLVARLVDGAVVFEDANAQPRLRMPAPTALDAKGTRRAANVAFDGTTLTLTIDPRGLTYPILLDPALEQVQWADLGPTVPLTAGSGSTSFPRVTFPGNLQRASASARSGNGRVYLFGGGMVFQSGPTDNVRVPNYTLFEWNGTAWSASAGGGFADQLMDASDTAMTDERINDFVYDTTRNKLVLFGGMAYVGTVPHLGLYEYDPIGTKTWTKVCANDSACAASSPVVTSVPKPPGAAWAFNKAVVVTDLGAYEWDPTAKLYKKFAATPDLKRAGAALAFDANRGRLVAYGNTAGASDTWETQGTTWTQVLSTGPKGVRNPSLTYHSARKAVILWASDAGSGGTWSWNGTAWTALTLSGGAPIPRANAAFAYDEARGKLLLVGGGSLPASGCFNSYLTPADQNSDLRVCARVDTWTSVVFGGACTVSADCGAALTCVDGVCCQAPSCGTCQRCDLAGSIGKCSTLVSAEDDTCTGTKACDATGACKLKLGQTCALGTDCLSGNCADGVCCNTSCPGACEACNVTGSVGTCSAVPAGAAGKGCGLFTCSGTSACATSCTTDATCASNAYCNGSVCLPQLLKGVACSRTRQCATGACVDGVCCDSTCSGTCDTCAKALGATADGTCTVLPKTAAPAACAPGRCSGTSAACSTACTVDTDCATDAFCNGGACTAVRGKGESCAKTSQCAAGLSCADGVCCNEACDGACKACTALNKESGDKTGECGPAKEGTNPRALCVKSATSSCGASGLCGATGSCALYAAGTPCGPSGSTSCDGDTVKGQTCDGLGVCTTVTGGTPCSPSKCVDGACKASCVIDADCSAEGYCAGGTCKKKAALGVKCAVDGQCASGFCADGLCCSARCEGSCEACDVAGSEGTCSPVAGKPHLGHPACASGDGTDPCSASACDGVDRTACTKKAGPTVACRKGSCEGDVESLPTACDGSGKCPAATTRPCLPYVCDADACKTKCATAADCAKGYLCNATTGACVVGDTCVGSVVTKVDGTTEDCGAYRCESSGKCKTSCTSTSDCTAPRLCSGSVCVDPAPPVEEGGGCAMGSGGSRTGAVVALAGLLLGVRRRRGRRSIGG